MSTPSAQKLLLVGRYRVIERLGSGGMATVMLAEDERLGRLVAIKRLPSSSPDEALARFRREARLGASLNHPNIVSIYDSTTDEDAVLIVMEYVRGQSLKDRLGENPMAPREAVAVLRQIAAALDHAHAAGVIHRDVKPSNVLIGEVGTAKLADLGIATAIDATRITSTNAVIGTLSYIAPERLEGAANDPSADVYSLAAVAYEALSGSRAQRGSTPADVVGAGRVPDIRDHWPEAPPAIADALSAGLSRTPSRRPDSAGELIDRLDAALSPAVTRADATVPMSLPATAEAAPARFGAKQPAHRRSGRRMAFAGAGAALAGVVVAILLIGGGSSKRATGPKRGHAGGAPAVKTTTITTPRRSTTTPTSGALSGATLNDRGYALIQQGRYDEAIPVLKRAVASFSHDTTDITYAYALFNLGHALRLAGRPDEAIPILEQRLQISDQTGAVTAELDAARADAGQAPAPSGGTAAGQDEPSGGVKPPKEPKPGKGPKGEQGGD